MNKVMSTVTAFLCLLESEFDGNFFNVFFFFVDRGVGMVQEIGLY